MLLTLRVARDWQPGRAFPTGQLLAVPGGFLGIDGPFRFGGTGVAERAMEVRQVGNGTDQRGRRRADAVLKQRMAARRITRRPPLEALQIRTL